MRRPFLSDRGPTKFVEIQFIDENSMRSAMRQIVQNFPRIESNIDDNTVRRFSLRFPKHYLPRVRKLLGAAKFSIVPPDLEHQGELSGGRGVLPKYDDPDWLNRETNRLEEENRRLRA